MDRATGPPAEAIAVPHQALVHNHPPRTPRTTGRPPALSQAEEIGAAPAHLRRDRARAEPAESFGAGRASCRPQTTRTSPGPWSWTALPCRAGTGSTSRARTRAGTTGPGRTSRTPAPRPEDPYGCPTRPPGPPHDARAPQLTGLLDNPPDTPPLGSCFRARAGSAAFWFPAGPAGTGRILVARQSAGHSCTVLSVLSARSTVSAMMPASMPRRRAGPPLPSSRRARDCRNASFTRPGRRSSSGATPTRTPPPHPKQHREPTKHGPDS